jgi:CRISPR-associated endonuclease/helicase Cas3
VESFDTFFRRATYAQRGSYGYQTRIAHHGLPTVLEAPTGTGKTGIVLAWLWRRLNPDFRYQTPRRLVYALPQRSLVDQVAGEAEKWLDNLGLTERVAVHVVMGGRGESQGQWRTDMHRPAIVIGTVDSLVSKALNRGYGIGRAMFPVDLALVTNGAHWVIDEIQLCRESTTTLRQLAAFARTYGTAEPFGLTCMSATVPEELLATVDNPAIASRVTILDEERTGELAVRLKAARTIRRLDAEPGDYTAIAQAARALHRENGLTIVVLNTVEAARTVYKHVRAAADNCTLLHSQFRGTERGTLMDRITNDPDNRIVIATQVVEAGIDLNASVMLTEAAPWPSVVQRAGRCNRTGTIPGAELWWIPPKQHSPYEKPDIDASVAALAELEGTPVTGEILLARKVAVTEEQVAVLRKPDFLALFDTSPDLSGNDLDVAPYIRDTDDMDAQLTWATWTPEPDATDGRPPADAKSPSAEYRCRVRLGQVNTLAKTIPVWRLDQVLGRWTRVSAKARARPGEVLLVSAADGGYDPDTGFDPTAKGPVPACPQLRTASDPPSGTEDAYSADSSNVQQKAWLSLNQHSEDVRDQAERLLAILHPVLADGTAASVSLAAYLHDAGKAHEIWQDALCSLPTTTPREDIEAGRPWAKSDSDYGLRFKGNVAFRHELASLLLLDGPLRGLLAKSGDQDLVRYLVLAHHGKLRVQVRDHGDLAVLNPGEASETKILGLAEGATSPIPAMFGLPAGELTIRLDQFRSGSGRSWTQVTQELLGRYGPLTLAYLEAVVRVADWRASGNDPLPEEKEAG